MYFLNSIPWYHIVSTCLSNESFFSNKTQLLSARDNCKVIFSQFLYVVTRILIISFLFFILQTFHGVWTIAFFCLTVIETGAILPNASCLLAGYLPATTVLHILLIPNNYPLEYIITDAVGTFLAIITMFLLLRMECTGKLSLLDSAPNYFLVGYVIQRRKCFSKLMKVSTKKIETLPKNMGKRETLLIVDNAR